MIIIIEWYINLNPLYQGVIATIFTYLLTALGAGCVYLFKNYNQKVLDIMMGIAAGVMIAASFWSLLSTAIETCEKLGRPSFIEPAIGFIIGGLFIILCDYLIGLKEHKNKDSILINSSMTLHNIPEGMAVGVAFGSLLVGLPNASLISAIMLAFGIGIQNFPEGLCAAIPLYKNGMSKHKAFFYGQISGIVEPIFGLLGILFAITIQNILPVLLSFSAGAMIAVVALELIPTAFKDNKILAAIGLLIGFTTMMILDISLG